MDLEEQDRTDVKKKNYVALSFMQKWSILLIRNRTGRSHCKSRTIMGWMKKFVPNAMAPRPTDVFEI
jgi:hypothetical protein